MSPSLMFSHFLVSKLCCGNITLHAADPFPPCSKHCLFTSKCIRFVFRTIFFLFPNSQFIPSCRKHCVFTCKCNLCASRPIFSYSLIHGANSFDVALPMDYVICDVLLLFKRIHIYIYIYFRVFIYIYIYLHILHMYINIYIYIE